MRVLPERLQFSALRRKRISRKPTPCKHHPSPGSRARERNGLNTEAGAAGCEGGCLLSAVGSHALGGQSSGVRWGDDLVEDAVGARAGFPGARTVPLAAQGVDDRLNQRLLDMFGLLQVKLLAAAGVVRTTGSSRAKAE